MIDADFEAFSRADHARVVSSVRLMVRSTDAADAAAQQAFFRARKYWHRVREHEPRVRSVRLTLVNGAAPDTWAAASPEVQLRHWAPQAGRRSTR